MDGRPLHFRRPSTSIPLNKTSWFKNMAMRSKFILRPRLHHTQLLWSEVSVWLIANSIIVVIVPTHSIEGNKITTLVPLIRNLNICAIHRCLLYDLLWYIYSMYPCQWYIALEISGIISWTCSFGGILLQWIKKL